MGKLKHGENLGLATEGKNNRSKLYMVWGGMRARCRDPKHISYKNYGARGIKVDSRWDDYVSFRDWSLSHGYQEGLDLDRIDNDGHYSPDNCQWATRQANVRKKYKKLVAFGDAMTMIEWSEDSRCKCSYYGLRSRLNKKWGIEEAISTPTGQTRASTPRVPWNKGNIKGVKP